MGPSLRWGDRYRPPLLLEDIRGALVAGEEVGALGRLDERLQRPDAGEQPDEVVLAAEGEDRVDQVVADAGLALLDLEAVGEEVRECLKHVAAAGDMLVISSFGHAG